MKGPIRLVRSDKIAEYKNLGSIYEWSEGDQYDWSGLIRLQNIKTLAPYMNGLRVRHIL